MVFTEIDEFMEIQPDDSKKLQNIWKGIGSIRPGAFGPRRTRKSYFAKKTVYFQFPNGFPEFAVESVDFIEKVILQLPETLAQPIIYLYFLRAAATGVD